MGSEIVSIPLFCSLNWPCKQLTKTLAARFLPSPLPTAAAAICALPGPLALRPAPTAGHHPLPSSNPGSSFVRTPVGRSACHGTSFRPLLALPGARADFPAVALPAVPLPATGPDPSPERDTWFPPSQENAFYSLGVLPNLGKSWANAKSCCPALSLHWGLN